MAKQPNVPQNPGSESGFWKCKLCDGLITESKESGAELGHHNTCPAHPDWTPPKPGKEM